MRLGNLAASLALLVCAERANAQYTLTTLATFNGANGASPVAGLIIDPAGNLYGTTTLGGDLTLNGGYGLGTVFKVAADGSHTLTTLATFNGANGETPRQVLSPTPTAICTARRAGSSDAAPCSRWPTMPPTRSAHWPRSTLAMGPMAAPALIADGSGNLYGTTYSPGTVFEVANDASHTLTTLVMFNGANGNNPYGGLIADASGNLYGTTPFGGPNGDGTVFRVANDASHTLTTLASFNGANGNNPYGGLIADASGNLYGTTPFGGLNGAGTVFRVANDASHTLTTLANFDRTNGAASFASLIADADGNLYGTAQRGGSNDRGTVFKVANDASHTLTTLATFDNTNGANPDAGLIIDAAGNLYGTTTEGGDLTLNLGYGYGTVFELSPVPEPPTLALIAMAGCFVILLNRGRMR